MSSRNLTESCPPTLAKLKLSTSAKDLRASTAPKLGLAKAAEAFGAKQQSFANNTRVHVRFTGATSPATVVAFDPKSDRYTVRVALTGQEVQVAPAQLTLSVIKDRKLAQKGQSFLPHAPSSHDLPRASSSPNLSSLLQPPGRNELSKLQLDIKALNWMLRSRVKLALHRWHGFSKSRATKRESRSTKRESRASKDGKEHRASKDGKERRGSRESLNPLAGAALRGGLLRAVHVQKEDKAAVRLSAKEEAENAFPLRKRAANEAWQAGQWETCAQMLNMCLELNGDCDALSAFRSRVHGKRAMAVRDTWPNS
jgi:hypothetical protein